MNDLRVLDAHAAFVDVGSEQMFVSDLASFSLTAGYAALSSFSNDVGDR